MERRRLGRTGLEVSLLGLGTGGANSFGQSRGASLHEARALVRRALDLGVDYFDTAAVYGDSELRLADSLEGVRRSAYVLATKYQPRRPDGALLAADDVDAALGKSLSRLRTDVIDVYQVHALRPEDYDAVVEAHLPVLVRAREAGRIRAIGVTEHFGGDDPTHVTLQRALADGVFDVVMVGYNVVHQTAERSVFPVAAREDVGVVIMAAVRRALATRERLEALVAELKAAGDIDAEAVPDEDPLGWLVGHGNPSVQAACYRYVAEDPAVSVVLTGTFDPDHLRENVEALALGPLRPADRDRLRAAFGHLEAGLGK
jgi:L-galactose dehydrogenase